MRQRGYDREKRPGEERMTDRLRLENWLNKKVTVDVYDGGDAVVGIEGFLEG